MAAKKKKAASKKSGGSKKPAAAKKPAAKAAAPKAAAPVKTIAKKLGAKAREIVDAGVDLVSKARAGKSKSDDGEE
ncbi:MAG: hypothetical protein NVS3B10_13580 [Polyangiales bacterium]